MIKIISTYTLTQYINKGQYGKVYKAINHQTQQYVAIKMISLQKFIEKSKLIQLTKQQVEILSKLQSNQNIIKLKQIIKSNKFLYMVYQYCQNGTLEQYISKRGKLNQRQAIKIFKQLIQAYKSLYQNNIVHRDIKTDNIFFKADKLKLADFGFCKKLKFTDDLTQTSLGSPLYMAPEVLNNDVYGSKADLWSCGIILYQMIFSVTPYGTCNIKQLLQQYSYKDDVPMPLQKRYLSIGLLDMLKRMLCKDQFRRISWQDFFYQYEFTSQGQIKHKQKDFEYDLMKLMKRNSSTGGQQKKSETPISNGKALKFDWSKITEMNSSVHSQQCNQEVPHKSEFHNYHNNISPQMSHTIQNNHYSNSVRMGAVFYDNHHNNLSHSTPSNHIPSHQQQISSLYLLKKTIKGFQDEHSKIFELLTIIETLLESNKDYEYDSRVVYFLVYNLQQLLKTNIQKVGSYTKENESQLQVLPQQKNKLQRLRRIFQKEYEQNSFKINSIKTTLITLQQVQNQIFRYPRKDVLRKIMKEYVQNYEFQVEDILSLMNSQHRQESIRLLKVLWGVQLILNDSQKVRINSQTQINDKNPQKLKKQNTYKYNNIISIKQQTSKKQISALINRYLVQLGI